MKLREFKPGWKTGIIVLLGIPLVIKAADISGDHLHINYWGLFGSSWTGNSQVNVAIGDYNTWGTSVQNSLTVGSNLKAYDSSSLVVGTWNEDTTGAKLFVIGRGTGSQAKANALEVHRNGTVIAIEDQGDIPTGDFSSYEGLANLGQLKNAATEDYDALEDLLPGGAGYTLGYYFQPPPGSPTQAWYDEQRNAVIIGELKSVASPLYDRLNDLAPTWVDEQFTNTGIGGHPHDVPWDPATPASDNYYAATVGQLLLAFGFKPNESADTDSIPDLLEHVLYGDATGDGTQDFDDDNVTDNSEAVNGTSLWLKDTDGDGTNDDVDAAPLNPYFTTIPADDQTGPVITILSPTNLP